MTPRLLRAVAILIAVAGVVDPAFTAHRPTKPDVAIVADARLPDPALADRVARALERDFTVIRGASIGAAATVSVGYQLPDAIARTSASSFAVIPAPTTPFVAIASVTGPDKAPLDAYVPVTVRMHVVAARGRTVSVSLTSGGVVIDSAAREIATDDEWQTVTLGLVAGGTGASDLRIAAEIAGTSRDEAPFSVQVRSDRWAVLVFDARPSWMSTFVRRALEADPRFVITSRTQTSRGAAVTAGRAPAALGTLPSLEQFQAVVVGAPGEITASDAAGLEAFMRTRGGSVVLLLDDPVAPPVLQRLTGIVQWTELIQPAPVGMPAATEFFRPAVLPPWVTPQITDAAAPAESALLSVPFGAGRLLVSTALDAWRYRGADASAFDRYWRDRLAEAADAAAAAASARASAMVDGRRAEDERDLLKAWTASRGGAVVSEADLETLAAAIARVTPASREPRVVRPMRSAWWIVPFGLALGGEWWLRRRRGLR